MKHFLTILLLAATLMANAKITYLPNYYSHTTLEEDQIIYQDSSITKELTMPASDQRISVVVMHDTVTKERVKAIKRYRAAEILSGMAIAISSVSAMYSTVTVPLTPIDALRQAVNYSNSLAIIGSASFNMFLSEYSADILQKLPVNIIVCNNTDREITVNDLVRGLFWYVRPYYTLTLSVGNPEINNLRIAYADTNEPRPCYVEIEAANVLERVDLLYEDEQYWVYGKDEYKYKETVTKYYIKDKSNMTCRVVSKKQVDSLIQNLKSKDK